jgi:hypothetical protein
VISACVLRGIVVGIIGVAVFQFIAVCVVIVMIRRVLIDEPDAL